ncbi:NEDD8-activating enzyme E1 regulatory subunit [Taenia solium]|eukprot:TsM_000967700 transcript=TsM_000967700 gene=TsM_000967700
MSPMTLSREQRYDRQLRLWGDRGQEKLGSANVCVLGANAVGSELLKNLVLPGIGGFTIVDDAIVMKRDLGSKFPRAQVVTEWLSEMNTEVRGKFLVENLDDLIENDPAFFLGFDAIVYTNILERIVSQAHIPIIVCVSVGFIGLLRVSIQEHAIIESHPDSTKPDFRLDNPPEAFVRLVNDPENDLDSLPASQLSQVPWLIIIYKFLSHFQRENGRFPSSYSDKQEIRRLINAAADSLLEKCRSRGESIEPNFELLNFQEASRAVNTAISTTKIPPEVLQIFEDCRCQCYGSSDDRVTLDRSSKSTRSVGNLTMSSFWKMVGALKEYTMNEGGGNLPLRGDLPDMTSSSSRYLKLLATYREAAETAVEHLASRLSHMDELRLEDVRLLARNAAYLRVIKCRSLEEELKLSPARSDDLHLIPAQEENDAMLWYFMLRGAASFYSEHGRWPGSPCGTSNPTAATAEGGDHQFSPHIVELDMPCLRGHVNRVLTASGVAVNRVSDDFVHEMCRFGGGEVHSVAAFMGGIAAQEVIKLVTHQFVPICQPLIYNAITQRVTLLEF